jgi:hypothetical protein
VIRATVAVALTLAPALAGVAPAPAQDWMPSESLRMAIFNLEVTLEVERTAMASDLERLAAERRRREELHRQSARVLEEVRALAEAAAGSGGPALDQKEAEMRALQLEAASSSERIRALRDALRAREDRLRAAEERLAALRAQLPPPSESLTGLWDYVLTPGGERGILALRQSGTLVGGEYIGDGAHHGSLQGTLIEGKVLFSRIDSRLGRSMELEGKVSSDGRWIRGSWQSLDVSGGKAARGVWQAQRRAEPSGEAPPPAAASPPAP